MTEIEAEKKQAPLGNNKPGGGSQVPQRQQSKKIPGDDDDNLDIKKEKPERKSWE